MQAAVNPESKLPIVASNTYQKLDASLSSNGKEVLDQPTVNIPQYNEQLKGSSPNMDDHDKKIIIVPTAQVHDEELPKKPATMDYIENNRNSTQTMNITRPNSWSRHPESSSGLRPSKLRESFGSFDSNDIEHEEKPKRHCCCFKSLLVCIGVIFVILAGIGLLIFFLFPSPPGIDTSDPFQPPQSQGFLINNQSITNLSSSILREPEIVLSIMLATNVTFNSTSYITFGVHRIDVTVHIINRLESRMGWVM